MALTTTIMSLFGNRSAPVSNAADPSTVIQQTAAAAANPTVPSAATPTSTGTPSAIPAAGVGSASPVANFNDLWKTDPNNNQATPSLVPSFNLDTQGLMNAAKKVDFTKHIDPTLVTKALSGDAASFLEVINQAAQVGFVNATAASGELIKGSLTSAQDVLNATVLPNAIRGQKISEALTEASPIFADPSVSPMLGMLKDQFALKYPTSTPQEIASMAMQYLSGMSAKIVSAAGGTVTTREQQQQVNGGYRAAPDTDFSTWD